LDRAGHTPNSRLANVLKNKGNRSGKLGLLPKKPSLRSRSDNRIRYPTRDAARNANGKGIYKKKILIFCDSPTAAATLRPQRGMKTGASSAFWRCRRAFQAGVGLVLRGPWLVTHLGKDLTRNPL
jgi:hypothetical protein